MTVSDKQRKAWMDDFANDWALNIDLFSGVYCGYWARGYRLSSSPEPERWLVCEFLMQGDRVDAEEEARKVLKLARKMIEKEAKGERREARGPASPAGGWFILDRALVDKAYEIGEKKWGERWFDDGDASSYDTVIQEAMLGEVRYG